VPELFEWSVVVDGEVIEVLAEQRRVGEVIYLDDIAVYPASGSSIAVGAAAVLRIARRELPKQFAGSGASVMQATPPSSGVGGGGISGTGHGSGTRSRR
jgi:CO dehydrogenase/acetyl-CoA synthase gamma subunit (corrinoid Fe-S protein)